MKRTLYLIFFISVGVFSQTAIRNAGVIQMHDGAEVGFHTNLVNDGTFDKNLGKAHFYSVNGGNLVISGTNRPIFHDMYVETLNANLELEVSVGAKNELWFVEGKIETQRDEPAISMDLIGHQFYQGEDDEHYVDGYNSVINYNNEYKFPIGDDNRLRPMFIPNGDTNYKGAYFFEDPSIASYFISAFDTKKKARDVKVVSELEFWDFDGQKATDVTLTWDIHSEIKLLVKDLKELTVVGWSKEKKQWVDLGNAEVQGDLTEGKIKSLAFRPDDYLAITFGSTGDIMDDFCDTTINTFTPDGDGVNDTFELQCADKYPPGSIYEVYDRWGSLVYSPDKLTDKWDGFSNVDLTVNRQKGLPTGVYFYLVTFTDETGYENVRKGWIYLIR